MKRKSFFLFVATICPIFTLQAQAGEADVCLQQTHQVFPVSNAIAISSSPDESQLAISTPDNDLHIYQSEDMSQSMRLVSGDGNHYGGSALAWSPDGLLIAAYINSEVGIRIWGLEAGEVQDTILVDGFAPIFPVESIAWSPSGRYIAFTGSHLPLWVWDVYQQRLATVQERDETRFGYQSLPDLLSWHPAQDELAYVDGEQILLWNAETAAIRTVDMSAQLGDVIGVDWSNDNRLAINGGIDSPIVIRDGEDFQSTILIMNESLRPHAQQATAIAWSPTGDLIASAGDTALDDSV